MFMSKTFNGFNFIDNYLVLAISYITTPSDSYTDKIFIFYKYSFNNNHNSNDLIIVMIVIIIIIMTMF